jgi:hypothetical protein
MGLPDVYPSQGATISTTIMFYGANSANIESRPFGQTDCDRNAAEFAQTLGGSVGPIAGRGETASVAEFAMPEVTTQSLGASAHNLQ